MFIANPYGLDPDYVIPHHQQFELALTHQKRGPQQLQITLAPSSSITLIACSSNCRTVRFNSVGVATAGNQYHQGSYENKHT